MESSTQELMTSDGMLSNITISPPEEEEGGIDWYNWANNAFLIVDPIITFGGIIGNILVILVMRRRSLRQSPVSLFLAALAVVDNMVLILDFINNYFKYYMSIYLLSYSGFCEFYRTIFNIAYTYATWLVLAVTTERFIVIWFPLKAKSWCTKRNAKIGIALMPVALFLIYFYNFFGYRVDAEGSCDTHPRLEFMINRVSPWLTAILYSYVPVILLFFFNIGIAIKLYQSQKQRRDIASSNNKKGQENNDTYWLTIMVIVVSVVFMILTIPATLWYAIIFAKGEFQNLGAKSAFIEAVVLLLALFNHSINFFIYTFSSANFRREMKLMFRIGRASDKTSDSKTGRSSGKMTKSTRASTKASASVSENPDVEGAPEDPAPGDPAPGDPAPEDLAPEDPAEADGDSSMPKEEY